MIEFDGALELYDKHERRAASEDADRAQVIADTRQQVDNARLALASLATPAVQVVAMRLAGMERDGNGVPLTDEREKVALQVLDRIGMAKMKTAMVRAHISSDPVDAADVIRFEGEDVDNTGRLREDPTSPGRAGAVDPSMIDAQIDDFLAGVRAARDLAGERVDGKDAPPQAPNQQEPRET